MTWLGEWRAGWGELLGHGAVPGYRDLPALSRCRLDLLVIGQALASRSFWRMAFLVAALTTTAQVLVWQLDLADWRGDLLVCLPAALVAPWVASGRRRRLGALLGHVGR